MMKKVLIFFYFALFLPYSGETKVDAELVCKTETVDCPGLFTGDRIVCHQNGKGISCNCGESTKCN